MVENLQVLVSPSSNSPQAFKGMREDEVLLLDMTVNSRIGFGGSLNDLFFTLTRS